MSNIFKIFISDAKRISQNVVAVVVIMGLSVIPSLYAWFNIFSNWDPYGPSATSNLKVAVVSVDKGTEIAGISVNIGSNVVDTLKSNDTIGWVFTDTVDEAVNGVYDNSYYAALVIPEEFTEEMISFLGGEIENPDIIYYENEKKNAIAPKITAKAKTTVQEQVNAAFVSTLAEVMMKVTGTIAGADVEGTTVENAVLDRLNGLSEDLHGYISILNSFVSIMGSAQSIVETSQVMLPGLDTMVSSGQDTVNSMEGLLVAGDATADSVTQMVNYSFDMISNTLDSVSTVVQNDMNTLKNYEEAVGKGLTGSQSVMPYLRKLFDNAVGGWEDTADDETQNQIQNIRDQMNAIELELEGLTENGVATAEDINRLETQITGQLQACKQSVADLKDYYTYTVKPNLDDTMNKMHTSMVTTTSILNGIDADFSDVEYVLRDYQKTLEQGSASLQDSLAMAQNLYNGLTEVIADFVELQQDEQYQEIMKIVESDPELLGNFISSPVNLDTVGIYEIEN